MSLVVSQLIHQPVVSANKQGHSRRKQQPVRPGPVIIGRIAGHRKEEETHEIGDDVVVTEGKELAGVVELSKFEHPCH